MRILHKSSDLKIKMKFVALQVIKVQKQWISEMSTWNFTTIFIRYEYVHLNGVPLWLTTFQDQLSAWH